jgi:hypothetical protein
VLLRLIMLIDIIISSLARNFMLENVEISDLYKMENGTIGRAFCWSSQCNTD